MKSSGETPVMARLALPLVLLCPALAAAITNLADVACGQGGRLGRIVGGVEASKGEFPWLVSIARRGGHTCGGTLINKSWVLTAAHCLCSGGIEFSPSVLSVQAGGHDLRSPSPHVLKVAKTFSHPKFVCSKYLDDIALIKLATPVTWSEEIKPACLPNSLPESSFSDANAVVSGWGWTNENSEKGKRANILRKVHLTVVGNEKCNSWYKSLGKKIKILDSQMCAGSESGGKDSCWADSGGPLMVKRGADTMVVGVVSTGIGCARPKLPGLYTRTSDYIPWITQTLKE